MMCMKSAGEVRVTGREIRSAYVNGHSQAVNSCSHDIITLKEERRKQTFHNSIAALVNNVFISNMQTLTSCLLPTTFH